LSDISEGGQDSKPSRFGRNLVFEIAKKIAKCLPANGAYFNQAPGRRLFSLSELKLGDKYRMALNNLSLGWDVAERYARHGQTLPLALQRFLLFRAYRYLSSNCSRDESMAEVDALRGSGRARLFVNPMLAAKDVTILRLAEWCCTRPKVILYYSRLCFNIRAHWHDRSFMTQLINPHLLPLLGNGVEGSGLEMMSTKERELIRVARDHGSAGVFKALRDSEYPFPDEQSNVRETRQEAARQALAGVLLGDLSEEKNEAIELLRTLAEMEGKKDGNRPIDDDAKMGLTRLSMSQGAQLVLNKLIMATAKEQIEAAKIYDESQAKGQKSEASGVNGSPGSPEGQPAP
jgi:hypothetical protein